MEYPLMIKQYEKRNERNSPHFGRTRAVQLTAFDGERDFSPKSWSKVRTKVFTVLFITVLAQLTVKEEKQKGHDQKRRCEAVAICRLFVENPWES